MGHAGVFTARSPEKESDNEDAATLIRVDDERGVLAIADGVGGQPAGAMAAALAVEAMNEAVATMLAEGGSLRDAILNGFEQANQSISAIGVGAATTLTVVEVNGENARPYHVGDSLILLVGQRGRIKLQTVSHSPVGYAVESGLLEERDAMHHEDRHLVSNMVGSPEMRIEIGGLYAMQPRDTLLLASDGLFDNLHTEEIIEFVRKGPLDEAGAQARIQRVDRGWKRISRASRAKPDDLTFIAYRRSVPKRKTKRSASSGSVSKPTVSGQTCQWSRWFARSPIVTCHRFITRSMSFALSSGYRSRDSDDLCW
jgi:PPM family protein phosphatase